MKQWTAARMAAAAGGTLLALPGDPAGPRRVTIDSRDAGPGVLFVGLAGATYDGGAFAQPALAQGAWGVITTPEHGRALAADASGAVITAEDALGALQSLARAWRRHLGAKVVGVTGSTGKTTTKDLLNAIIAPQRRARASRANFNTEIGLPLEILDAPEGTEVLILEMGMRGPGQIAELASIAEPDVGVIVSVGPVHLELLGSIEAIAAAKSELTDALKPGGTAIVPADEPLLLPHRRADVRTVTFGAGGEVTLRDESAGSVTIEQDGRTLTLKVPFTQAHMRRNLLAAVAGARAVDVEPEGEVRLSLSAGRGQRRLLAGGITIIDDCYNANPMSMRASLEDLARAERSAGSRRIAVLGDMLELGADERRYHRELGEQAAAAGVDLLIAVGPLAGAAAEAFAGESRLVADAGEAVSVAGVLVQPGDTVLVKGSRGVGLERVVRALEAAFSPAPSLCARRH